jgi:Tol biopolymer transport system component
MRLPEGFPDGLSWSPDGQRIAFVADRSIYVIGDDGTNPTRLQAGEPQPQSMGGVPSWSADGTSVVATAWFTDKPDILALNADGSGATPIANTPVNENDAAWSPDGGRIAYWRLSDTPRQAVHVVDADGTHEATIFESDSPNGFSGNVPSWSADGKHLAFLGEGSILCTVDADGSNLRVLLRLTCSDSPAPWSPDGGAIAASEIPCGE